MAQMFRYGVFNGIPFEMTLVDKSGSQVDIEALDWSKSNKLTIRSSVLTGDHVPKEHVIKANCVSDVVSEWDKVHNEVTDAVNAYSLTLPIASRKVSPTDFVVDAFKSAVRGAIGAHGCIIVDMGNKVKITCSSVGSASKSELALTISIPAEYIKTEALTVRPDYLQNGGCTVVLLYVIKDDVSTLMTLIDSLILAMGKSIANL